MKAETTKIFIPRTLLETGVDKDIELEGTLADYLPGINRVVRTEANIYIDDTTIKGTKAEVRGKAVFALLYESDYKSKLRCERFTADFSHSFDIGETPEGESIALTTGRCSYVSCKTLNPRRFILKCRADLGLKLRCMQGISVISAADLKGAFFKTEGHRLSVLMTPIDKSFSLRETVSLEGMPPVGEVIYASLCFAPAEHSLSEGSVLIHSTAMLKCLYEEEGDEGALRYIERSFPVAFTVDSESLNGQCELSAEICCSDCEVVKEMDGYGEMRVLSVNGNARVTLELLGSKDIELPIDLFFEEYESESKADVLVAEKWETQPRHRFSTEKLVEAPEFNASTIIATDGEISVSEVTSESDEVWVSGVCAVSILGKGEDGVKAQDVTASFKERLPLNSEKDCRINAKANMLSAAAELRSDGRVSLRINAELSLKTVKKERITALTGAEINARQGDEEDNVPLIIYYPDQGETAWDIGKRYHRDPQAVISENADAFDKAEVVKAKGTILYM